MRRNIVIVPIHKASGADPISAADDLLAVEEPLQIRVNGRDLAITMRTPGHDRELAAGFLFGEGIVRRREDIAACEAEASVVRLELATGVEVDLRSLERNFYVTSRFRVCGTASIGAVRVRRAYATPEGPRLDVRAGVSMPALLRAA